ncbi:MAG TPA: N-acetyltransferase [Chloroflexia bacterium]|nr:N-acetyltransferase [Chloroflexia bacterium]
MLIRPETVRDYAAIAAVHAFAFDNHAAEASIVALLRHHMAFDPDLSLVAEDAGQVVGHVLFSPYTVRLLGQDVRAVNLAPIAVHPAYQGKGIGGQLIREGHALAHAKGYPLSFLLGHPTYYPRFGYQTHVYGSSSLTIPATSITPAELGRRAPIPGDIPILHLMWLRDEGQVDFALDPGTDLMDWVSPSPIVQATVYTFEGDIVVGYMRTRKDNPGQPLVFLARAASVALAMAGSIAHQGDAQTALTEIVLPLHPSSRSGAALGALDGAVWKTSAWGAGMACPLAPSPFDEYHAQLKSGERIPGRVIWPVAFEIAS